MSINPGMNRAAAGSGNSNSPDDSDSDLESYMEQCRTRVQHLMAEQLQELPARAPRLLEAMHYACMQGGKRIRPVLCYASAQACGGDWNLADAAACATEYMHCYSLIHDDLPAMDDDDLRRGQPTVHKAFDEATAILAGDALQALSLRTLSQAAQADAETRLEMVILLADAGGYPGMVSGQAIDFLAVGKQLTLPELENMHRLKTGALINASIQLGALSAKADAPQRAALLRYGQCIGLSFQVQDDILDVIGHSGDTGKPQGSDQALNKPTYVSLLGLEGARTKAQELTRQALDELAGFGPRAETLRQLAHFIVSRSR